MSMKTPDAFGIFHPAPEGSYSIPPELKHINKMRTTSEMSWLTNKEEIKHDLKDWHSDPSRIIFHDGRYHMWMIDLDREICPEPRFWANGQYFETEEGKAYRPERSRILYLSSENGEEWTAHHHVPLGPPGSCYDYLIEQPNVVFHEGRFHMFTQVWSTNVEKYGQVMAGITCLVADKPEGPWALPPGVDILLRPALDGKSWDDKQVLNPRHAYINGKWFMFYKGGHPPNLNSNDPFDVWFNGVAIADDILGPYERYEGNPLLKGHGHFCWKYKHGLIMIPNYGDYMNPVGDRWIHWSEDGIHFAPIEKSNNAFAFGSLYSPCDPLFGEPQTSETPSVFWGFECIKHPDRDLDLERIEWSVGSNQP